MEPERQGVREKKKVKNFRGARRWRGSKLNAQGKRDAGVLPGEGGRTARGFLPKLETYFCAHLWPLQTSHPCAASSGTPHRLFLAGSSMSPGIWTCSCCVYNATWALNIAQRPTIHVCT